MIAKRMQYQ